MTHEQQQPMSDARLAEIRELVQDYYHGDDPDIDAVMDLLADNERLRAREAALVEIVRAVAEARLAVLPYEQGALVMPPHIINHQLREQARALLASADASAAASASAAREAREDGDGGL